MQYPYGWEFACFTHCCEHAPNMEELINKNLLNLLLCYFLCTCLSTSQAWENPQRRARMFPKREVKVGRVKACTRSRQNRCSSLAMGWWVGPGTVNREGPSEGPIFLYCWSEGWGVKTASTGMSRVRWGLRMASPCESKWCSIEFIHLYTILGALPKGPGRRRAWVNPAPDQAGARIWGFPTQGEPPEDRMTYCEKNIRGRKVG